MLAVPTKSRRHLSPDMYFLLVWEKSVRTLKAAITTSVVDEGDHPSPFLLLETCIKKRWKWAAAKLLWLCSSPLFPSLCVPHPLTTSVYAGCIRWCRFSNVQHGAGMNPLHDIHIKIQSLFACVNDIILLAWCGCACGRDIIISNDRESANLICCFLVRVSFVLEC